MAVTDPDRPHVDRETPRSMVVEQSRPVIGLSSWIAGAITEAEATDREFVLVTPPGSRITYSLQVVLTGPGRRWVLTDPAAADAIDVLTGEHLRWDGAAFVAAPPPPHPVVTLDLSGVGGGALHVSIEALHPATQDLQLGGSVEAVLAGLDVAAPYGWGVSEPVTQRWSRRELTRLCHRRSPIPTTVVLIGGNTARPALGTLTATRVDSGVHEEVQLAIGADSVPHNEQLVTAARVLTRARWVRQMLVFWQPGLRDTTRPSSPCPLPVPLGLFVGEAGRWTAISAAAATAACTSFHRGRTRTGWVRFGADPYGELATALTASQCA